MNATPPPPSEEPVRRRLAYWRSNLRLILVLLTAWATVSLGMSILFVEWFNQFSLGNVPFGFWMAQQGSIYGFIIIIGIYVFAMDRLDRRFRRSEDGGA